MPSNDVDGSPILILTLQEAAMVKDCLDFLDGLPQSIGGLDDAGRELQSKLRRFLKDAE